MILRFRNKTKEAPTMNLSSTVGRSLGRAVCLAAFFFSSVPAFAQLFGIPASAEDNNPECMWRSTLLPNPPGTIAGAKSEIMPNAFKGNPAFDFTSLVFSTDVANIAVVQYFAWVNVQPAMMVGAINRPANNLGDEVGGAAIGVKYTPPVPGGVPATIHWLQVVRTNAPAANLPNNIFTDTDGFSYFIDNLDSKTTLFYDLAGGAANGTHFVDRPFNRCPEDCNCNYTSTFHLFAAESIADGKTKVYADGIVWGFNFQCVPVDTPFQPVPEASTLWGAGGLVLLVTVHMLRKRKRALRVAVPRLD
jgi:hypothetical protein